MIALWLAVGLLAASSDAPPAPDPIGGGGKFEDAAQEWDARREWTRKARELVAELDAVEESAPEPPRAARERPQASLPALAYVAPALAYVAPALLDFERLLAFDNQYAQALMQAIALRDARAIAEAAWMAEQMLRMDEQVVAMLLLVEIA